MDGRAAPLSFVHAPWKPSALPSQLPPRPRSDADQPWFRSSRRTVAIGHAYAVPLAPRSAVPVVAALLASCASVARAAAATSRGSSNGMRPTVRTGMPASAGCHWPRATECPSSDTSFVSSQSVAMGVLTPSKFHGPIAMVEGEPTTRRCSSMAVPCGSLASEARSDARRDSAVPAAASNSTTCTVNRSRRARISASTSGSARSDEGTAIVQCTFVSGGGLPWTCGCVDAQPAAANAASASACRVCFIGFRTPARSACRATPEPARC